MRHSSDSLDLQTPPAVRGRPPPDSALSPRAPPLLAATSCPLFTPPPIRTSAILDPPGALREGLRCPSASSFAHETTYWGTPKATSSKAPRPAMIANSLLVTIAILLGLAVWLMGELRFLIPYKRILIHQYGNV